MTLCRMLGLSALCVAGALSTAMGEKGDGSLETRPLSPAQVALFETPHLKDIVRPETLSYRFDRAGPETLNDTVVLHVQKIHPDGTKYISFDFLSGDRRVFFPAVDDFKGNPLLMLFLENDVREMKDQTGIAATYLRDRIRDAFVDRAFVSDETVIVGGQERPARRITLKPFADDPRLVNLTSFRAKTYQFVLSDSVPGQIERVAADMPADSSTGAPAWSETITFKGETPE